MDKYKYSQRRACGVLGVNRTAYRYEPVVLPDENELEQEVIDTACNYGRVGYRMVTDIINNKKPEGEKGVNHKRVERIWREKGLKLPENQVLRREFG